MKYFLLLTTHLLLPVSLLFSQTGEKQQEVFDSIFYHIYIHTASRDLPLAMKSADSLYRSAVSDIHKVRALMLISDMHHRMASRDSSVHYALQAERIASSAHIYDWQARIYGVLSTQYRETGLLRKGQTYIEKGLQISEKLESPNVANQFKGQIYQEKGFYALEEDDHRQAIVFFKQADTFFQALPESRNKTFVLSQNEERLGLCYLRLHDYDLARYHYQHALDLEAAASDEETPLKGFIYSGLGEIHLDHDNRDEAFGFFEKAHAIAETTGFPNLKKKVYENLAQYYKTTDDTKNHLLYNEKYLEVVKEEASKHRRYADGFITRTQQQLEEIIDFRKPAILIVCFLVLITGVGGIMYRKKQKRDYQRFMQLIKRLREEKQSTLSLAPSQTQADSLQTIHDSKEKEMMPAKTEQELLAKLRRFEATDQFTSKNISIAVLAGKLNTNTKYLSYLINTHRQKDFNTYINELRINYIVVKMEEDPKYLKYKISYLAGESGFSSHSKFTTVFKNVTGLTPSTFMDFLRETKKESDSAMAV